MPQSKEKLHQKFHEEYQKLNENQRRAVDTIEGPVMVIAGPGTGKTQILASRIGKILLETDALPGNILCLTFTDAGVVAMRKRLLQFIGPDAYKVHIYTFHAFCHDVIQENLSLFEKTSLDVISELEKIELFKELIDTFPKNHPLKRYRGNVYYEINNLRQLFSTMKQEDWKPAYINEKIDEYIASLPTREEYIYKKSTRQFKPGDLKIDKLEDEKERMERLRAAVNEFERYQALMRNKNRYDFDDMINWVIRAFTENKNLLARYQEQFLYILVDEYQDTSGTQNKLVQMLISYWDKPNVFVVGDDDQSIFRFQGANIFNLEKFAESYKNDLLTVVLTDNYRSTQPILDVSRSLINRNEERLVRKFPGYSKNLLSKHEEISKLSFPPVINEFETQRQEMIHTVLEVEQLLKKGINAGEIAIIYKENKYGEELAQYFKLKNIPVFSKRNLNLLEVPLAHKIILLLRYLAAEHDIPYGGDEMLFEILHFDWFGIPPMEIAKLTIEVADKRSREEKSSLRRCLYEKANAPKRDLFSQDVHEGLKNASAAIEKLLGDVPNLTLQQLFECCIRRAGILTRVMQSTDKHWQLRVLTGLFEFVKEETHRNPSMNLQQLINIIDLMEAEKIPLPLVQVSGNDQGVNLLTAHGSKGLEFEHVFFAGCNASLWEKKKNPARGYKFPDTMFSSIPTTSEDEELRRLFYVAITRPKKHLYISYNRYRPDGKDLEPSMFIAEIRDEQEIPINKPVVSENDIAEFSALHFGESEAPEIEKLEEEIITRLLERFVMNVTALNNYLKCPLEFYFKNLIRIPSPKNEATEFGSAVHYALERLFRPLSIPNTEGNRSSQFHSRETFVADFEWYMNRHRESFTREQFARRMEAGPDILRNYYDRYINSFNKVVAIERNIGNVVVKGVPLKGKLDKLEFDGKSVNVVDYKTGDADKAKPKLKPPTDEIPNGGDYWRQAVFYKILVDNYEHKEWKAVSTEFDFIEPDKKNNFVRAKVFISPADIETVTQQIVTVWQKIQARDFYTGCGKEDCHWCRFVKTNNLQVALHELEEEEESRD